MMIEQYIGLKVEDATILAKQAGMQVSFAVSTGPQMLNNEFKAGRITFHVENGVVVSASLG